MRPFHIGDKYSFTEKNVHNSPYPIKLILNNGQEIPQLGFGVFRTQDGEDRIKENFDVFDFELTPEDMAVMASLERGTRTGSNPDTFTF